MRILTIKYRIEERIIKRRFWFDKKEYYIACEFSTLGPFKSREEATEYLIMAEENV